jgi:hypothetical protein
MFDFEAAINRVIDVLLNNPIQRCLARRAYRKCARAYAAAHGKIPRV